MDHKSDAINFQGIKGYILPGLFLSVSAAILILLTTNYNITMLIDSPFLIMVIISCLFSFFSALAVVNFRYKSILDTKVIQALRALYILPIIFWIPVAFLGSFLTLNMGFYITVIFGTSFLTILLSKRSKQLASIFAVVTTVIVLTTTISNFEEAYCYNKGQQADPSGIKYVTATKEDAELLKAFGVKEGAEITLSFREHIRCHKDYQISEAIKDLY